MTGDGLRIVALADTDSYVKWSAALLGGLAEEHDAQLLVVETPLVVSDAQLGAALAGSGLPPSGVRRVGYAALAAALTEANPDAVVIAARGPVARVLARLVAGLDPRPVIVTGLPGISIPATSAALIHRTQCDLFVLHSRREVQEFSGLATRRGLSQAFALSTLPFSAHAVSGAGSLPAPGGTDLVFASQAIVPRDRADRQRMARLLLVAARADPRRRVVVKERAAAGEHQTHRQRDGYPDLLAALGPLPSNLVISTGPMARALDTAEGLVTVSSTAAIEAVARGIPVIALDAFGVSDELINTVFLGSGLLASERAMTDREFRHPTSEWRRQNYFHPTQEDDWLARLRDLVSRRRGGTLPPKPPRDRRGGRVRDIWERKVALGRKDRSAGGVLVALVGYPLRVVLRPMLRVRGRSPGDRHGNIAPTP